MNRLMKSYVALGFGLALLVAAPHVAYAVSANAGRLIGTVTEAQTGAPVPGAQVSVSGPSLGAPTTTTTNEDGSYELANLPPGTYQLEVSYAGVKPLRRRVVVIANQATPVNIAWSAELAQAETTVVVEQRVLTKPDSPMTGTTLSLETENKLPIVRNYQSIVSQVAGTLGAGNPQIKGSGIRTNKYFIDGLDTTDPVTHTFSANINLDSISSIQVITGALEAKYSSGGGIINLITNSGSDEFHADASFYIRSDKLQLANTYGNQVYDGIRPYSDQPLPPIAFYQVNIGLNGPIIRHHLWFAANFEYDYNSTVTPAGPPLNVQAPNRVSNTYLPRLKLTFSPNSQHKFVLQTLGDPAFFAFANNDTNAANNTTPLASTSQDQGGYKIMGTWDYFISRSTDIHVLAGYNWQLLDNAPEGLLHPPLDPKYGRYDPTHSGHSANGTVDFNSQNFQTNRRNRVQLEASLAMRFRGAGYHDAEVGFQGAYTFASFGLTRLGEGYPNGGIQYTDSPGGVIPGSLPGAGPFCDADPQFGVAMPTGAGCNQRTLRPNVNFKSTGEIFGLYIQDRWKPVRWLTLIPGVRWDFARVDSDIKQPLMVYGFGPRFSALFDLTNDQKTIFQLSYGRINDSDYLEPAFSAAANIQTSSTTQTWNPNSRMFVTTSTSGGAGGTVIDTKTRTPPHYDEFITGLRREIFRNSVAGVEYTYKYIQNQWQFVQQNFIWDPAGDRLVGFRNGQAQSIFKLTTPDGNNITYQAVDFFFEGRPTPNWDFAGSYTLSWRYGQGADSIGDYLGTSQYDNIRQKIFYDGFLPNDLRHNIRVRPTYAWHGIAVGANINWTSGQTVLHGYSAQAGLGITKYRAPLGIDPGNPYSTAAGFRVNDTTSWTEFRLPDLFTVDLHVHYDLYELIRQHVQISADFFNLLNIYTATAVISSNTAGNDQFGQANGRPLPFRAQFGLRYYY